MSSMNEKRPISRAFSERDCLRAAQIRNPGSFSSSVYLIWNWIWYLRQEIWISSGSRNRKRKTIRISDENGKHTAAVHKTVHSGFFRVRKGLSGHKPSFLLYFWEGRGIICRKCVEQHH